MPGSVTVAVHVLVWPTVTGLGTQAIIVVVGRMVPVS